MQVGSVIIYENNTHVILQKLDQCIQIQQLTGEEVGSRMYLGQPEQMVKEGLVMVVGLMEEEELQQMKPKIMSEHIKSEIDSLTSVIKQSQDRLTELKEVYNELQDQINIARV